MQSPSNQILEIAINAKYASLWQRIFKLYWSYLITLTILAILYAAIQGFSMMVAIAWVAVNLVGLLIAFIDAAVMLFSIKYDTVTGNITLISAHYNQLKEIVTAYKNQIRAEAKEDAGTRGTRWRLNFYHLGKPIYSQKINRWWNGKKLNDIQHLLKDIQS